MRQQSIAPPTEVNEPDPTIVVGVDFREKKKNLEGL